MGARQQDNLKKGVALKRQLIDKEKWEVVREIN